MLTTTATKMTKRYIDTRSGQEPKLRDSACTVSHAVRLKMYGVTDAEILSIYPTLTPSHLRAAMDFAAASGDSFFLPPQVRAA